MEIRLAEATAMDTFRSVYRSAKFKDAEWALSTGALSALKGRLDGETRRFIEGFGEATLFERDVVVIQDRDDTGAEPSSKKPVKDRLSRHLRH